MRKMNRKNKNSKKYSFLQILRYALILVIFVLIIRQWQTSATRVTKHPRFAYETTQLLGAGQENYDVKQYQIFLSVQLDSFYFNGNLQGITQIKFSALDKNLSEIFLNLSSEMRVDSIPQALKYGQENNLLHIWLKNSVPPNTDAEVRIYYHGWPKIYHQWIQGWKLKTVLQNGEKTPVINTVNPPYGAQTWFPCKDDPADKADSVSVIVNVPDSLLAVSNGRLEKKISTTGNRISYFWKESYPISTYLITVNIGEFIRYSRTYHAKNGYFFPIEIYCFPSDTSAVDLVFRQLNQMFDFFTTHLGDYPFRKERYAMIKAFFAGGMENQTISSVDKIDPSREKLFAHELAHQWLGDMVTPKTFHDSWINEGLATYFTGLYLKYFYGETAFRHFMNVNKYLDSGKMRTETITNPDSVYNYNRVYKRSSWFFYMLHQYLGDSVFYQSVRFCLNQFAYSTIDMKDLQQVFEKISGKDLSRFFREWILSDDVPTLDCRVELQEKSLGTNIYAVKIKQLQDSDFPFLLPLEMKFGSVAKDSIVKFELFKKNQSFEIHLPFLADQFVLDPSQKILMNSEVRF